MKKYILILVILNFNILIFSDDLDITNFIDKNINNAGMIGTGAIKSHYIKKIITEDFISRIKDKTKNNYDKNNAYDPSIIDSFLKKIKNPYLIAENTFDFFNSPFSKTIEIVKSNVTIPNFIKRNLSDFFQNIINNSDTILNFMKNFEASLIYNEKLSFFKILSEWGYLNKYSRFVFKVLSDINIYKIFSAFSIPILISSFFNKKRDKYFYNLKDKFNKINNQVIEIYNNNRDINLALNVLENELNNNNNNRNNIFNFNNFNKIERNFKFKDIEIDNNFDFYSLLNEKIDSFFYILYINGFISFSRYEDFNYDKIKDSFIDKINNNNANIFNNINNNININYLNNSFYNYIKDDNIIKNLLLDDKYINNIINFDNNNDKDNDKNFIYKADFFKKLISKNDSEIIKKDLDLEIKNKIKAIKSINNEKDLAKEILKLMYSIQTYTIVLGRILYSFNNNNNLDDNNLDANYKNLKDYIILKIYKYMAVVEFFTSLNDYSDSNNKINRLKSFLIDLEKFIDPNSKWFIEKKVRNILSMLKNFGILWGIDEFEEIYFNNKNYSAVGSLNKNTNKIFNWMKEKLSSNSFNNTLESLGGNKFNKIKENINTDRFNNLLFKENFLSNNLLNKNKKIIEKFLTSK